MNNQARFRLGVVEGWVVTHDGETLKAGFANDEEAALWLLSRHPYNIDRAVRREGYDIVLVRGGKVEWSYKRDILGKERTKEEAPEVQAVAFEAAVRQAFMDVYGQPSDPDTVVRAVRSSYLESGRRMEWTEPDPGTVLVLTEHAWVQDPYRSPEDHENWETVVHLLQLRGWPKANWDSINPAVQVVYFESR